MDTTFLEEEIKRLETIISDRDKSITLSKKQQKEDKWLLSQMKASLKRRTEDANP